MTPRNHSKDLTADLLRDLETGEAAPTVVGPSALVLAPSLATTKPAPFIETSLYLAPRAWRRLTIFRAAGSLMISAGPVRLRIGRRPS